MENQEQNTWSTVVVIGLCSKRIRILDNRLVTVPNATVSNNEVVNHAYPDSRYRIETAIGVFSDSDLPSPILPWICHRC